MHWCLTCCTNQFLCCGMWGVSVTADDSETFYFKNVTSWCWQLSPKNIAWQHCGNFQTQHRAKHTLCFSFFSLILFFFVFFFSPLIYLCRSPSPALCPSLPLCWCLLPRRFLCHHDLATCYFYSVQMRWKFSLVLVFFFGIREARGVCGRKGSRTQRKRTG